MSSGLDPIVIYSLPKTASSTLRHTLEGDGFTFHGRPVVHAHLITADAIAHLRELQANGHTRMRDDDLELAEWARKAIEDPARRPVVIAATRHPFDRAVSTFFQSWQWRFPWIADGRPVTDEDIDRLHADFRVELPKWLSLADTWFDTELRATTGIDAFGRRFEGDGWQRYDATTSDVAIVRSEDLSRVGPAMLEELVGERLELRTSNASDNKMYKAHLDAFRDRLRLTDEEADAVRSTRHARHFYAPEEIEARLARYLDA